MGILGPHGADTALPGLTADEELRTQDARSGDGGKGAYHSTLQDRPVR